MTEGSALGVEGAAARAGVSVDTIRRAYRSGALRAYRPAGQRKVVIRPEDLDAWAFSDEQLVVPRPPAARRRLAGDDEAVMSRRATPGRSRRGSAPGSVERLREIERSG